MRSAARTLRVLGAFATASLLAACSGKTAPPAYGEALVVVDTDLPVPTLAGRLRVDLYDEHGTWFESRDIGRSDPRDWPASFSVYSTDDTRDTRVLVRVRVYPEGMVRDYRGERFEPRTPYVEPHVAASIAELCASAPTLPLGGRITARRGSTPITEIEPEPLSTDGSEGACSTPTRTGSIAAKVVIPTQGRYRFDVAGASPYMAEASLVLRSRCEDPSSQIACGAEPTASITSAGHFPRFDATLDPGTYYLVTGGSRAGWPADLTLEVLPLDQPLPDGASSGDAADAGPGSSPAAGAPRLVRAGEAAGGSDPTPTTEPLPTASVDRLVLVHLAPGVRGSAHVTLHATCAGTMARLGADPTRPEAASAETCVETEGLLEPVRETPLDPDMTRPTESVAGSAAREAPCDVAPPSNGQAACIPGGLFLFGNRLAIPPSALEASSPERLARISPFYLDRTEVSVGRLRAAMDRGLHADDTLLATNDAPFTDAPAQLDAYCTWTSSPGPREDFPVNCVTWRLARAFCVAEGGDLPTEAQWEYAAIAAGRDQATPFVWGSGTATCDTTVILRVPSTLAAGIDQCVAKGAGPQSVEAARSAADVTPAGVIALGGNVAEWARDGGESFSSACWRAATFTDPSCVESDAALRSLRGSDWTADARPGASRSLLPGDLPVGVARQVPGDAHVGFRCAYPGRAP